jgi:diacylglycerol kinase (ATP)
MNELIKIIKKLFSSIKYSMMGIKSVWQNEQAFRLEVYLCLVVMPVIVWIPTHYMMKLLLGLLLLLLLVTELLNSAIEAVVDRISLEMHPLSKVAKDAGSAAVGIVILMNALAWAFAIYGI